MSEAAQETRWCVYCFKNIPVAEYVKHDIQQHNGLWRARDYHRWVCEFDKAGHCTCRILEYDEWAERLNAKCVTPAF